MAKLNRWGTILHRGCAWDYSMRLCQVERDVMVWNNKMYRKNPVLVKEDALIAKHRRWYSQFYSENSPTYESVMKAKLDW
jgi:hypothetical protein